MRTVLRGMSLAGVLVLTLGLTTAGPASADVSVSGYQECPGGEVSIVVSGAGRIEVSYGPPGSSTRAGAELTHYFYTYSAVRTYRPIVTWVVRATRLNSTVDGDLDRGQTYATCDRV